MLQHALRKQVASLSAGLLFLLQQRRLRLALPWVHMAHVAHLAYACAHMARPLPEHVSYWNLTSEAKTVCAAWRLDEAVPESKGASIR